MKWKKSYEWGEPCFTDNSKRCINVEIDDDEFCLTFKLTKVQGIREGKGEDHANCKFNCLDALFGIYLEYIENQSHPLSKFDSEGIITFLKNNDY